MKENCEICSDYMLNKQKFRKVKVDIVGDEFVKNMRTVVLNAIE